MPAIIGHIDMSISKVQDSEHKAILTQSRKVAEKISGAALRRYFEAIKTVQSKGLVFEKWFHHFSNTNATRGLSSYSF